MSDSDFTIDKAQIVGGWLQAIMYGIFLVTFFPCIRALLFESGFKLRKQINWLMLSVALLLAIFGSMDTALGLLHNIQAFTQFTGAGGAIADFSDISDWINVMKSVDIFMAIVIGDAVLIYRCWVVYAKNYPVIILPVLIWMATTACAGVLTWLEATLHAHILLHAGELVPFLTAFTSITICQNIITTGLIVYRIWRVDRESAQFRYATGSNRTPRRSKLHNVMRIVIESGLLYTTFAIMSFVTFITNSNGFYCTTDMEIIVIPICFNLIIIRAQNQSQDEYTLPSTLNSIPLNSFKAGSGHTATTVGAGGESKSGLQVMVMQETDSTGTYGKDMV